MARTRWVSAEVAGKVWPPKMQVIEPAVRSSPLLLLAFFGAEQVLKMFADCDDMAQAGKVIGT